MFDTEFANPEFFWLFLTLPAMIAWYIFRYYRNHAPVQLSSTEGLPANGRTREYFRHSLLVLRLLGITAIIVALARPQSSTSWRNITTEGIDIVIALDISSSMLAKDLKPNRLDASKKVAIDFISERPNDRMGLVVYSGESFTQCPLTTDHDVLKNLFSGIRFGMIKDGTAIGMGLANAVNRLKESEAPSKVAILLTDGSNTTGSIPPLTAAEIAKTFGVRVYTIGVGTNGKAPTPFRDRFGNIHYQPAEVKIDEATLKEIARITGGAYFRATDNDKLQAIYQEIDQLEKTIVEEVNFERKNEEFWPWLLVASLALLLEALLQHLVFRTLT